MAKSRTKKDSSAKSGSATIKLHGSWPLLVESTVSLDGGAVVSISSPDLEECMTPKEAREVAEALLKAASTAEQKPRTAKPKKIQVSTTDLPKVCFVCGKVSDTTRQRSYTTNNYQGGCGDSFCWASCELSSCKPISVRACESCEKQRKAPPG